MKLLFRSFARILLGCLPLGAHEPTAAAPLAAADAPLKVLVYSNTGYYRHPEIPKINRWLVLLGHENGFEVDVTEHWKDLQPEALAPYDVLLLKHPGGDPLGGPAAGSGGGITLLLVARIPDSRR